MDRYSQHLCRSKQRPVRIGSRCVEQVPGDPARHAAKAHLWQNGYHEAEHALVMAITAAALHGEPAELYFALPAETAGMAPRRCRPCNRDKTGLRG